MRTAGDKEARGKPGEESRIKAKRGGSFQDSLFMEVQRHVHVNRGINTEKDLT